MYSVTIINIVAVLILIVSTLISRKNNVLPGVIFMLIMFFSIRLNYGNDYPSYEFVFNYVNSHTSTEIEQSGFHVEAGWVLLNQIFAPLGFRGIIILCTIIQFSTIGWFISKYVAREYQWYVMFVYLFYSMLMLVNLSMLRQMMAISIFLWSVPFLLRKNYIVYYAMMLLGTQFHNSALATAIVPILQFGVGMNYKKLLVIYGGVAVGLSLMPQVVYKGIDLVMSSGSFERYEFYWNRATGIKKTLVNSGIGLYIEMGTGLYLIYLMRLKSITKQDRFFIIVFCTFLALIPVTMAFLMAHRLQFYFLIAGLPIFGILLRMSRKDVAAAFLLLAWTYLIIVDYMGFFYNPVWRRMFMHYHTILD